MQISKCVEIYVQIEHFQRNLIKKNENQWKNKKIFEKYLFSKCMEISMHIDWFCKGNQLIKKHFVFFVINSAINVLILHGNFNNFWISWTFQKNSKKINNHSCNCAWSQNASKHECTCVNMLTMCIHDLISGAISINTHSNWMDFSMHPTWMRVIVFSKGECVLLYSTRGPLLDTITRIQVNNTHSSRMHWKSIQFECMLTNLRVPRALRHSCVRDTELWAHIVSKLTDVRAFRLQAWLRAEITLAHFKIHGVSIKNHLFQIVYAARHALKHP